MWVDNQVGDIKRLESVRTDNIHSDYPEIFGQDLQLCFSTSTGPLSWAIRKYTGSAVSHCILTYRSYTLDRVLVMEASGAGFRVVPWAKWERHNTLIGRFRLNTGKGGSAPSPLHKLTALRALSDRLGDPYDVRGLFGFLPTLGIRIANWWRVQWQGQGGKSKRSTLPRFRNFLDNPKRLFCSQAVAEYLYFATQSHDFKRPQDWSPKNLFDYVCTNHSLFTKVVDDKAKTVAAQAKLPKRVWKELENEHFDFHRPVLSKAQQDELAERRRQLHKR